MYETEYELAEKMSKRKEYYTAYNLKTKEKFSEYNRNYRENNKNKIKERRNSADYKQMQKENDRKYNYNNKEKRQEYRRLYTQNNKEKKRESDRKYREKKKNEMESLKNEISKLKNIQSNNNEGTSFVIPQNNDSSKASDNLTKILNEGAKLSVAPQSQKYKEKLKTSSKNEPRIDEDEKKLRKKEYDKERYQMNKEKICGDSRKYRRRMKENIENLRKNRLEIVQNINSELINIESKEGNLLPNTQNNECENKEKEPIVSKENIQLEKGEDVEVNDNAEKGEDTPIQSSHNLKGIGNAEGTSFVNPQTDDCVNNLSDPISCPHV
uniref:Uncharacterized protein n=1 Tax=Meloidogyne incognita TaxID=6306 RepID=A0A914LRM9_MELIC